MIVAVAFAQAAVLFANTRKSTGFPAFVYRLRNPIDAGIAANSFVVGIDQDNFVILVNTVLVHPIRVQDSQITTTFSHPLLCSTPKTSLELQVIDTLTNRFTVGSTFGNLLFAVTAPNADAVNNVTLLSLVAQPASLVRTRGAGCAVDDI